MRLKTKRNEHHYHPYRHTELSGEGWSDIVKSVYNVGSKVGKALWDNKGKIMEYGKKAVDLYSSDTGTALKNMLPDNDANGRPAFPGEKHTILELPNGKYGMANYMGPGTHISARLRRGDPPRTEVDRVARSHDLRYALANNVEDIRKADNIMLRKVAEIERDGKDSKKNLLQAKAIYAKTLGEDAGLIPKGSFSKFAAGAPTSQISDSDKDMLKGHLYKYEQEGYGMLPGEALKMKLLKKEMKKMKLSKKGSGILSDSPVLKLMVNQGLPTLLNKIGVTDKGTQRSVKQLVSSTLPLIEAKKEDIPSKVADVSKVVLNLLMKQAGGAMKPKKLSPEVHKKLLLSLSKGMMKFVKAKQSGKGMKGSGYWDDFYEGFKSVVKPGFQVLGGVADALGAPEIGIPLQLISGVM